MAVDLVTAVCPAGLAAMAMHLPGGQAGHHGPESRFVIEGYGLEAFWEDMGVSITGRKAGSARVRQVLPVAFVLHRLTCLCGDQPKLRRVERGTVLFTAPSTSKYHLSIMRD